MNKSEKLLAARKKLKEFQMNKGNHNTINNSPNQKHAEDIALQENDSSKNEDGHLKQKNTEPCNDKPEKNLPTDYFHKSTTQVSNIIPEVVNTVNRTIEENIQQEKNLLDLSHDIQDNSKLMTTGMSSNNNNYEPQSAVYNGAKVDGELIIQSDALQSLPISRKPSIPSSVGSNNLNNHEYEAKTPVNYELESQNKILSNNLEEEKNSVKQLSMELNQYKEKVFELESCLAMKNVELEAKISEQVNPLREQIHYLTQTTNILVAEKAELSSSLGETQTNLQQKFGQLEDSNSKLKIAQNRVEELERELYQTKNVADKTGKSHQQLENDNEGLKSKCTELGKLFEEQKMEVAELRQDLNIRSTELANVSKILEEKTNSLSLAELKIQQLTNAPQGTPIEDPSQSRAVLEQQVAQLKENMKSVTLEKDELYKHYDSYVKQLDAKYENAVKDLNSANTEIEKFKEREESLIQRLSLMEQQYQREKQKAESLLPLQSHEAQIKHLTDSMDSLVLEQETLQSTLREKETEIQSLNEELKELRELRDQGVEVSKLVNALESEQLGASRAVSQNEQLKFQLGEMHDAFVTLSNSKLNLTEQLQDERAVGRKLNKELNKVEWERDQLKEELMRKDETIQELEKEKLQAAQIADQMHHYQAQSYNTRTLQQELQNALSSVEVLNKENLKLKESVEKLNSTDIKVDDLEAKIMKEASTEIDNGYKEHFQNETKEIIHNTKEHLSTNVVTATETKETQIHPHDLLSEPLMKLEKRFKETIERVAELTDEKQRLEHLVLQLQGETETIGEYVTLYQKQRAILQYKSQEREQLFRQLIEQRQVQQTQLHQLKMLVADLLTSRNSQHTAINDKNVDVHVHTNQTNVAPHIHEESIENKVGGQNVNEKRETEEKILELLTEIKDCKDTCSLEPNFHPCLWCSGKLITV